MRILVAVLAVAVLFQEGKPINAKCPVKTSSAAKERLTTTYKGHVIGFCCQGCKDKFAANPEAYAPNVPELAALLRGPKWIERAEAALAVGKSEARPVGLVFVEKGARSDLFLKILGDASVGSESFEKVAFAKVAFTRDSEEAKRWKVADAPALVLIDNTGSEPQALKTVKSGTAASLRREVEEAVKKVGKR